MLTTPTAACFEAWCGTDYKVRLKIKGKEIFCKEDGQKASVPGYTGYVYCPPGKVVCANMPRVQMINMLNIMPDRGAYNGKNLITITGNEFDKYENLSIKIGPTTCTIINRDDTRILCRVEPFEGCESYKSKAVSVIATGGNITTELPESYTFTSHSYDAGIVRAVPALVLLVCAAAAAFFV